MMVAIAVTMKSQKTKKQQRDEQKLRKYLKLNEQPKPTYNKPENSRN